MDDKYVATLLKSMVTAKMKVYLKEDLQKEADKIAKSEAKKFVCKAKTKAEVRKAVLAELTSRWPKLLSDSVARISKRTTLQTDWF